MKKLFFFLSIALFAILMSCSDDSTNPSENPENVPDPKTNYIFDVKTTTTELLKATGAKNGLIAFIKNSSWGKVEEFGEDYSVGITNIQRTEANKKVTLSFKLSLCEPGMLALGKEIISRNYNITYDVTEDIDNKGKNLTNANVNSWLKTLIARGIDVYAPGAGVIANQLGLIDGVLNTLTGLMTGGETSINKAEGVLVGNACFYQLKLWINDIEKK